MVLSLKVNDFSLYNRSSITDRELNFSIYSQVSTALDIW